MAHSNLLKSFRISKNRTSLYEELLIRKIRKHRLTYLSKKKLQSLAVQCHLKEVEQIPGIFIEAGCALGGSSILMGLLKQPARRFFIYDVFEMIPPPTGDDTKDVHARYSVIVNGNAHGIGGDAYYGYIENLYETVLQNLDKFGIQPSASNISLVKGRVQDTLCLDEPVAIAHIDVDWYEPVMTCLSKIFPRLSLGGTIILDDYHSWGGCRKATDEYLTQIEGQFQADDRHGAMLITRVKID